MLNPLYREPRPPEGRPIGIQEFFYKQGFKIQCFIFLKYREKWTKKMIMKFLFISSEHTYYKIDRKAKSIVKQAYHNTTAKMQ